MLGQPMRDISAMIAVLGKAAMYSGRHPRRDDPGRLLCFGIRGYFQLEQVATFI